VHARRFSPTATTTILGRRRRRRPAPYLGSSADGATVADWQDGVDTVKYVVQLHLPLQSFCRMPACGLQQRSSRDSPPRWKIAG
jgi:hypothetical protein